MTSAPVTPKPTAQTAAQADPTKTAGARQIAAPFRITSMERREPWLKLLGYGKHGSGKTELMGSASSCPQMEDVLMLDAESGDLTLQDNPNLKHADKISHIRIENFKQAAFVYDFLKAHCIARDNNDLDKLRKLESAVTGIPWTEIENPKKYRTVIVDSLSEIEAFSTQAILNWDEEKVMKEIDSLDVAGWPEFRKNMEAMKLFCRRFRDLPMHVLFSCAESYTQDEQKKYHYAPYLTGKLSTQVQGFMDLVGYLVVGAVGEEGIAPRRLYVQPTPQGFKFDAKCRLQGIKGTFIDIPPGRGMETILKAAGLWKES